MRSSQDFTFANARKGYFARCDFRQRCGLGNMRSDTTFLLCNIMTLFFIFLLCLPAAPGVPAALPCGRHHVYIYHIVHSLLMHAYFDQLGIHPHPQHKLVQEDKQKLHLVQDTEVWNLVIGALATARSRSHDLHFSILHSLIFVSLLHSLRVRILTVKVFALL